MEKRICRSSEEWLQIAMECRKSGLSDKDWCMAHGISCESFKGALKRLRKKGISVPKRSELRSTEYFDLTAASRPEPVQIQLVPDDTDAIPCPVPASLGCQTGAAMEVCIGRASVRIPNGTVLESGRISHFLTG